MDTTTFKVDHMPTAQMLSALLNKAAIRFQTTVYTDGSTEFEFSTREVMKQLPELSTWIFLT